MRPRTAPTRLFFLLLAAVLQAAMPAAVALADGALRAGAGTAVASAHVEAPGGSNCPAAHVDDCTLCRALSLSGLPNRAPTTVAHGAARALAVRDGNGASPAEGATELPPARAPPAV